MATLTGEQLKDSYQSLVTIGDSITSDPTSGVLENGKGTPITDITIGGDITIADKIIHSGDTNTAIRFPANDTVTIETAGLEAMRIDSNGNVGIGTTSVSNITNYKFVSTNGATGGGLVCQKGETDKFAVYSVNDDGYYDATSNHIFRTGGALTGTEAMRIDSSGNVRLSGTAPSAENTISKIDFYNNSSSINLAGIEGKRTAGGTNYGSLIFNTTNSGTSSEKMRILSSGGITFNGDTATANALDDYEEGTFTPTIAFGGGSTAVTYTNASGYYTKIGNIVHFTALIDLSSKGTDTGDVTIGGLPFTATSASGRFPDVNTRVIQNVVVDTFLQSAVLNNTTTVGILQYNSTTDDQEYLTDADFSNNSELNVTGFYFT